MRVQRAERKSDLVRHYHHNLPGPVQNIEESSERESALSATRVLMQEGEIKSSSNRAMTDVIIGNEGHTRIFGELIQNS